MPRLPDPLPGQIQAVLETASGEDLAHVDQLAAMCRDWFDERSLDLAQRDINQSALTSLTMVYAMLQSGHAKGELSQEAWDACNDVISTLAAAVTIPHAQASLTESAASA